jgi:LysM repeat protein
VTATDPAPIAAPVTGAADTTNFGGAAFYAPTRPGNPAVSALVAQPVSGVTPATTYTVAHGDSLWSIAKKSHL